MRIKWKQDVKLNIAADPTHPADFSKDYKQEFKAGSLDDVDVFVTPNAKLVNITFRSGDMAFAINKNAFSIIK
jgi:hypothetical protein